MGEPASPLLTWTPHPWVEACAETVHFGIANGPRGDWPALVEFVAALEDLGFDSFWSSDHPVPSAGCWTTLAGLAATTRHIRLGSLVACIYYWNPVVLARTALDIDAMSGGRLVLGLGIGDLEHEFAHMGIPWRGLAERQQALDETIECLRYLWSERADPPATPQFAISAPPLQPRPGQRPRIPLLVAGGGQKVTLRQVAQYADASNFGEHAYTGGVNGAVAIEHRMEALARHCRTFHRAPESVLRTHTTYPLIITSSASRLDEKISHHVPRWVQELSRDSIIVGTPDDVIARYDHLLQAGLQYFIAFVYGHDLETVKLLATEVMPEVRRRHAARRAFVA